MTGRNPNARVFNPNASVFQPDRSAQPAQQQPQMQPHYQPFFPQNYGAYGDASVRSYAANDSYQVQSGQNPYHAQLHSQYQQDHQQKFSHIPQYSIKKKDDASINLSDKHSSKAGLADKTATGEIAAVKPGITRPNFPLPGENTVVKTADTIVRPGVTRPNMSLPGENNGRPAYSEAKEVLIKDSTVCEPHNMTGTTCSSASNSKIFTNPNDYADGKATKGVFDLSISTKQSELTGYNDDNERDLTEEELAELEQDSPEAAAEALREMQERRAKKIADTQPVPTVVKSSTHVSAPVTKLHASSTEAVKTKDSKHTVDERSKESKTSMAAAAHDSHDTREHVNIVFIGHVDAGKSTISGQILLLTGQVDDRMIQKYEKEAKEKNRESWYLAYILDTNEEERAKGKTVEVGRAHFETQKKRFTLLDAPGHKNYVPNMIGGAQQADVGVLVISARRGEFEAGFDRGGQTREHATLAKTLGLQYLVVLINKMDDPSVNWSKERYSEIVTQLSPFLRNWGYNLTKDVFFVPCSGFTGANLRDQVPESVCPWISPRRSFFQVLDELPSLTRDATAPFRLPIISKFKDMGFVYAVGKIESGSLVKDSKLIMQPNNREVLCTGISIDEDEVDVAKVGENVLVRLKGIEEEEIISGFVLSYPDHPCRTASRFDCEVMVLELLEHKPLLTAGYSAVMHVHAAAAEVTISGLIAEFDKKTKQKLTRRPKFAKEGTRVELRLAVESGSLALETFANFPQLGRFTLRDEGKTIAIGKVTKIVA